MDQSIPACVDSRWSVEYVNCGLLYAIGAMMVAGAVHLNWNLSSSELRPLPTGAWILDAS